VCGMLRHRESPGEAECPREQDQSPCYGIIHLQLICG
jgi:hypothetical protein